MWLCRARTGGGAVGGARLFASLVLAPRRPKSRKLPTPSRENDPFLPLPPPQGVVVRPGDFTPPTTTPPRVVVPPRGDMTVEKFLGVIGRGTAEHAGKFPTWDALMTMRGSDMKVAGIPVKPRKWILSWVEHYKQGVEPRHLPIVSRAKKNKFLSKKKVKTALQKKRD